MKKLLPFFFSYVGSKNKISELEAIYKCLPNMNDVDVIIEPFCGSCAITRNMEGTENKTLIMNDIDKQLMNFLSVVIHEDAGKQLFEEASIIYDGIIENELIKQEYRKKAKTHTVTLTDYYLINKYFRNRYGFRKGEKQSYEDVRMICDFFRKCRLVTSDYTSIFQEHGQNDRCLMIIDPPYLDSYNANYSGYDESFENCSIKDNTKIYVDLVKQLEQPNKILIIINENALTRFLFAKYIKSSYDKTYQYKKTKTKHLILTNYPVESDNVECLTNAKVDCSF